MMLPPPSRRLAVKPRSLKLLDDIRVACDHIVETIATASLAEYLSNYHVRNDIECERTRLGEATNLLLKEDPTTESRISSVPNIVGMRHHLVHGYERIENEVVWETARDDIPRLHLEVAALIEEHISRIPS
jgi:uncharacterized protein with HEPN domain